MFDSSVADKRPFKVQQAIGWINVMVASVGLLQLAINVMGYSTLGQDFMAQYAPFMTDRHRFARMSITTLFLLLPLGVVGVQLVRRKAGAAALAMGLFIVEILVLSWLLWAWGVPSLQVAPLTLATGLMNGGIAFQIVTAYPVVGLILLWKSRNLHAA
ncbi:MAG TPA: hypothetical protein VMH31_10200 [Methylomirabilota bacterium]|nr:hypothetical protein [Methylomirabilota bacterium]